jgi:hypothetical protein
MFHAVGTARIGQWYKHVDKGDTFVVTGYDDKSRTIETQGSNGDLDEIDQEMWDVLPLELVAPPEDWTEAQDDINGDDTVDPFGRVEKLLSQ